jgi:hypothetical protein
MNRRIRNKLHKRYLNDISLEVSTSSFWRKKIFQSAPYEKFVINKYQTGDIWEPIKSALIKYNLRYYVYMISFETAKEWQDWDSTQIIFRFEPIEFPDLLNSSANNPNVI